MSRRTLVTLAAMLLLAAGLAPVAAQEPQPAAEDTVSAAALSGPCMAGGAYDPACDVNHDGAITTVDLQLAASNWGTSGTWTSGSWDLTGNAGTEAGTHFLGTIDDEPLELRVSGARALRLEPHADSPSIVAGHAHNAAWTLLKDAVVGATIGGGGAEIGSLWGRNRVTDDYGTIGGGAGNRAGDADEYAYNADFATVGGGWLNTASATHATVGGGRENTASANFSAVVGGYGNTASGGSATVSGYGNTASGAGAAVGGGLANEASGHHSAVCGGSYNTAGGTESLVCGGASGTASGAGATVIGGHGNAAAGDYSLALGYQALAKHTGAFVWSDPTGKPLASTAKNQFVARASGGMQLYADAEATNGVLLPPGSGAWSVHSDRNAKTDFAAVDGAGVLEALSKLPIEFWRYKTQTDARHMGPTAQDFYAAFGLGASDTQTSHISTVDTDGVALAAIQALYAKVEALEAENAELRERFAALEAWAASP